MSPPFRPRPWPCIAADLAQRRDPVSLREGFALPRERELQLTVSCTSRAQTSYLWRARGRREELPFPRPPLPRCRLVMVAGEVNFCPVLQRRAQRIRGDVQPRAVDASVLRGVDHRWPPSAAFSGNAGFIYLRNGDETAFVCLPVRPLARATIVVSGVSAAATVGEPASTGAAFVHVREPDAASFELILIHAQHLSCDARSLCGVASGAPVGGVRGAEARRSLQYKLVLASAQQQRAQPAIRPCATRARLAPCHRVIGFVKMKSCRATTTSE